ncbi:MAG TPA: hypothetical protein VGO22_17325 [Pseudorhizobium sp.]|nr:hypothetical protein [Pseudorhizobium sp.]
MTSNLNNSRPSAKPPVFSELLNREALANVPLEQVDDLLSAVGTLYEITLAFGAQRRFQRNDPAFPFALVPNAAGEALEDLNDSIGKFLDGILDTKRAAHLQNFVNAAGDTQDSRAWRSESWIAWDGEGRKPRDGDCVAVRYRYGSEKVGDAGSFEWWRGLEPSAIDIIAYRLVDASEVAA